MKQHSLEALGREALGSRVTAAPSTVAPALQASLLLAECLQFPTLCPPWAHSGFPSHSGLGWPHPTAFLAEMA